VLAHILNALSKIGQKLLGSSGVMAMQATFGDTASLRSHTVLRFPK
jgi:hypothetical protein